MPRYKVTGVVYWDKSEYTETITANSFDEAAEKFKKKYNGGSHWVFMGCFQRSPEVESIEIVKEKTK
jgi:hypothetical protein